MPPEIAKNAPKIGFFFFHISYSSLGHEKHFQFLNCPNMLSLLQDMGPSRAQTLKNGYTAKNAPKWVIYAGAIIFLTYIYLNTTSRIISAMFQ